MRSSKIRPVLLLLPFILVTVAVLASIFNIIMQSMGYVPAFGLEDITLKYYIEILHRPEVLQSLWVSVKLSVLSSLLAAILGTLLCAAVVYRRSKSRTMEYLVRIPILVPHAVVAVFTIAIFAQTGLLARLAFACVIITDYTEFPTIPFSTSYIGVILGYLWKEIPFIAYFTMALMSGVSETLGEAAENLGASPIKSFFNITLPMSMPAILRGFIIVLVFSFGGYEMPLLLGSTLPKAFPVYTYIAFINPELKNRPYAMAMNGITLLFSFMAVILYAIAVKRLNRKIGGDS